MFYYARCLKEIFDLMYRDTGKKNLVETFNLKVTQIWTKNENL